MDSGNNARGAVAQANILRDVAVVENGFRRPLRNRSGAFYNAAPMSVYNRLHLNIRRERMEIELNDDLLQLRGSQRYVHMLILAFEAHISSGRVGLSPEAAGK